MLRFHRFLALTAHPTLSLSTRSTPLKTKTCATKLLALAGFASAALLGGCGAGGSPIPQPTASSSATPALQTHAGRADTMSGVSLVSQVQVTATPPGMGERRVACIGDSITYGSRLPHREVNAYPVVLERLLGKKYLVGNFGVPSATLLNSGKLPYQKQTAFTQALQFKPSIVLVMLGTNDSCNTFDFKLGGLFKSDYKTLINAFRQVNPSVKVYTCLSIPSQPQTGPNNVTLATRILPLVRQVARETNSQLLDLNTPFTNRADLYSDVFHPNVTGANYLASKIYDAIT